MVSCRQLNHSCGQKDHKRSPKRPKADPLFANALLGWLDDMALVTPKFSLEQLDAILEVQQEFTPRNAFLTEMRRVYTTLAEAVAAGKPFKRMATLRVGRAATRCKLPKGMLQSQRDSYRKARAAGRKIARNGALSRAEHRFKRRKEKL